MEGQTARDAILLSSAMRSIEEKELNAPIMHFWDIMKGWKWEKFSSAMSATALMKLAEAQVDSDSEYMDSVSWLHQARGGFR